MSEIITSYLPVSLESGSVSSLLVELDEGSAFLLADNRFSAFRDILSIGCMNENRVISTFNAMLYPLNDFDISLLTEIIQCRIDTRALLVKTISSKIVIKKI